MGRMLGMGQLGVAPRMVSLAVYIVLLWMDAGHVVVVYGFWFWFYGLYSDTRYYFLVELTCLLLD
jgi:hypothetical protein